MDDTSMKARKADLQIPLNDLVACMLELGLTENFIVRIFADYPAHRIENLTKYFYNKKNRKKINDFIFKTILEKPNSCAKRLDTFFVL